MSRDRSSHHFERFCATGEPAALAKVFDLSAPELMRVACYLSGDRHVAEDLVQASFLTAIESRREFTASREVMPWLIGILINKVRAWRRSKQKSQSLHVDAAARLLSAEPGPADEAAADELRAEFTTALDKLDDPYRQVLEMHLVHDLTAKETAELLRRPAGTVRTQIVRGLEILRRTLPSSVISGAVVVAACTPARLAAMRELIVASASAEPKTNSDTWVSRPS
jgi:RNA polymerase sigma factor (sigma-70 family)